MGTRMDVYGSAVTRITDAVFIERLARASCSQTVEAASKVSWAQCGSGRARRRSQLGRLASARTLFTPSGLRLRVSRSKASNL